MKRFVNLVLLCFFSNLLLGQKLVTFSHNKEEFIKQLSGYFNDQKKGMGKDFIEKEFEPIWLKRPVFSTSQEESILTTMNLFLEYKIKVIPDFEWYIKCLIMFNEKKIDPTHLVEFHNSIEKIIKDKKNKKNLSVFLESCHLLFESNTFYKTENLTWKVNRANYKIQYDSVPHFDFSSINLICLNYNDSSVIHDTQGSYFPFTYRFAGDGGIVNWIRVGLDPNTTYAQLDHYKIKNKTANYIVDSVVFYSTYFNEPLVGKLTEKVLANKDMDNANFPKFESYSQHFEIPEIEPGIDYSGGFTMSGGKFVASGTTNNPAKLTFKKNNKPFLIASSLFFEFKDTLFLSSHTAIKFLVNGDSITHPDLALRYFKKTRYLTLTRTELGLSKSSFANTYHNLDMYAEAIQWQIDEPRIYFGAGRSSTLRDAAFESNAFFSQKRMSALSGISSDNPLDLVSKCGKSLNKKIFTAMDLAQFTKRGEEDWHIVLIDLANKGFIQYDIEHRRLQILPKLENFILNAQSKKDYDILQFNSTVNIEENAMWSLLNYDLFLKGVSQFYISDTQKVMVFPKNGELTVQKNRNLLFGGKIKAGNLEFMGSEYFFDYEKFQVELKKVDSCQIYINDYSKNPDQYGEYPKIKIKSKIKDLKGTLYVDAPNNKSGTNSKKYTTYPYVTTTEPSYVDWESWKIENGRYPKDKFYYKLEPFTLDSLDNFKTSNVRFKGMLVSAGIFEDINEPLVLMDDNSLGFHRSTGPSGYPAYRGFSNVVADLTLNYSGLQGKGSLTYLNSKSTSDKFVFLPDETKGKTNTYTLKEKITKPDHPKTSVNIAQLNYYPQKERLTVTTIDEPIVFFEKEATLIGATTLQPEGLSGRGMMDFYGAQLGSEHFTYERRKIKADTSNFALKNKGEDNTMALKTDNMNASVDFDKLQGRFISNTGETKIEFPTNLYICYMDEFTWFMKQDMLEMSSSKEAITDVIINAEERKRASNFYSVASGQDSLNFLAPRAKFDIAKNTIFCEKVNHIVVADAKIQPDSGKVVIERLANMRELNKALLTASYVTEYHQMFNVRAKIEGRKKYHGEGDMAYVDENEKQQILHLDEIKVDTMQQTIAKGQIAEETGFHLSPQFAYYGKFKLEANQRFLYFDGGVKIEHPCEKMEKSYFKFACYIDPNEIFIPMDTLLKDINSRKLGAGMMVKATAPMDLYPTFLSPKLSKDDFPLISASGFLHFDKNSRKFFIGTKEKILQPKLPGNLIELSYTDCDLIVDGEIDFHTRYGMIDQKNFGKGRLYNKDGKLELSTSMMLSFPFDESAMKLISEKLEKSPDLNPVDVSSTPLEKSLIEILGQEKADKSISELTLSGQFKKVPEEIQKSFYFADLNWTWSKDYETFHTVGPIGIATMDKKQIFKYVKGKIEIEKRKAADVLRIYIQVDPTNWYYFEYKMGTMTAISGDAEFVKILSELKDDKKQFERGKDKYNFQLLLTKKKRDDLKARFKEDLTD